ncbi:hypothetical protein AVEN_178465-1 [Araneus ventricosus]|uniref:Mos1 transposase HTH domain-containing protein n=1 Tax=Araneus ventricosus TaxID=182803 RepID=A0A4Y2CF84_ARAVE|nr:hypothetical protein AVEN_178465-1 [Araneus ventricosus]
MCSSEIRPSPSTSYEPARSNLAIEAYSNAVPKRLTTASQRASTVAEAGVWRRYVTLKTAYAWFQKFSEGRERVNSSAWFCAAVILDKFILVCMLPLGSAWRDKWSESFENSSGNGQRASTGLLKSGASEDTM